jgi:hypothetical protein
MEMKNFQNADDVYAYQLCCAIMLSSFTAPRGPLSPLGNVKRGCTNFIAIQRTSFKLKPFKADRNIFI